LFVPRSVLTRKSFAGCAVAAALVAPPAALAVSTANSGVIATAASTRAIAHGTVTGTVGVLDGSSFTVQRPGRQIGVVNALIATADRILAMDTPYVYGGGHTSAGTASIGIPGPGYDGKRIGFDCSGAVGAVLAGAGLWLPGSGVPRDDGIITQLRREGMIAPGIGKGPVEVTLWDHPTVHIFMNINGRFFGTSDGGAGADAAGGAGWLDDGAPDTYNPAFKPYHLLPWVVTSTTGSGQALGLQARSRSLVAGLAAGEKVRVRYRELSSGTMVATAVTYPGSVTATGTVSSIAPDGSSFALQSATGTIRTVLTGGLARQSMDSIVAGDTIRIRYSKVGSQLIAHALTVSATPVATTPTTTTPTTTTPTTTTPTTTTPVTTSSGGSPLGPGGA
jgi:cell wall-associated NlpC family hydrolase